MRGYEENQNVKMGIYTIVEGASQNNMPIYKNIDNQYLYHSTNARWLIDSDYTANTGMAWVRSNPTLQCPQDANPIWGYSSNGYWFDKELQVTCHCKIDILIIFFATKFQNIFVVQIIITIT